jgi:hypothetical protein
MNKLKNLLLAALLGVCAQAFAGPTLTTAGTPNPAMVGATVDVDVMIGDIADLYAYQFTLNFDQALFKVTGVSEGGFLGTAGATFSDTGLVDNGNGTISFVFNTLLGPAPGAFGSGNLLHITFEALGAGSSSLVFSELMFLDSALADINVDVVPGAIQAQFPVSVPEPASFLLFGAGLFAVAALRRKQRV